MKMDKFRENKEIEAECFMISDPLYSHFGRYKMCLRVDANGISKGGHMNL